MEALFTALAVVFGLLLVALCGFVYTAGWTDGNQKGDVAIWQAGAFVAAIRSYHHKYGEYPSSLEDILVEKNGRRPLLDGGFQALKDPWGNPYQFAIEPGDGDQPAEVRVWTISPKGERYEAIRRRER